MAERSRCRVLVMRWHAMFSPKRAAGGAASRSWPEVAHVSGDELTVIWHKANVNNVHDERIGRSEEQLLKNVRSTGSISKNKLKHTRKMRGEAPRRKAKKENKSNVNNPSKVGISRTSHFRGLCLRLRVRRRLRLSRFPPPVMETPAGGSADRRVTGSGASAGAAASSLSRYGLNFSASSLLQAPLAALLEYSGVVPSGPVPQTVQQAVPSSSSSSEADGLLSAAAAGDGEVSIRIQGDPGDPDTASATATGASPQDSIEVAASSNFDPVSVAGRGGGADAEASGGGSGGATGNGAGDRPYQRYDVHHVARWIEQILPFSLLLLVVFIRQHLQDFDKIQFDLSKGRGRQGKFWLVEVLVSFDLIWVLVGEGFFVTIWIAAVMFKSNDILKKQTALKGERKVAMLVGITIIFMVHVFGVYWWYMNDYLLRPLFMVPPKDIPPFWHAIFIIMVNGIDTA
ncbi:unnamed protein product [Triticum turgidum subsp. durum]|uniref:Uncharacterized protein n=1 Tax=Triticum turgidum subsp. durum TaxID=4567 RepID=A0A9R0Q4X7_TRITD|nr:unnamed protein product [Triticum turgidum subsp. durum]